jgi:hypothetical protein
MRMRVLVRNNVYSLYRQGGKQMQAGQSFKAIDPFMA